MEKRLILAIALSLLILLSWSTFVAKTQNIANKEVATINIPAQHNAAEPAVPLPLEQKLPSPSLVKYTQEKLEVTFIEPQAAVQEVIFKTYRGYRFPLKYGFLVGDKSLAFKKESASADDVVFVYSDQAKKITKKFLFSPSDYGLWLELSVENLSLQPLALDLPVVLGVLDFAASAIEARYQEVAVSAKEKTLHLNARRDVVLEEIEFLSIRDRYFCSIIEPASNSNTGFIKKLNPHESEVGLILNKITLAPGQRIEQKFHIYLGPQDLGLINAIEPRWSTVINYGMFDIIAQMLLWLLHFFYGVVHNWGWAILILSLTVYLLLFPLSLKQMRSMKAMQLLQPHIEELRKTYKDNPQRLNKEIMELYRAHKVNPLGGCLPLVLQMPIFFALYQALMRSVVLRGAPFLWIKDLSEPDRLFILPVSLPILGNEINILPLLMTLGMFIQQKVSSPTTASGSAAEQQKAMLIIMPLMFGFIFYKMPSGLVLYWFTNSTLMLLYQIRTIRKK